MATSTSRSTHFRTTRARRRSRHFGKACRWSRWPGGRLSDVLARPSCMRSGWMTGSPTVRPTAMWHVLSPRRLICLPWHICAPGCVRGLPHRRCVMLPDWHAMPVEAIYRTLWDEWREGDVPRLHRLYQQGDVAGTKTLANRLLQKDPAHAEAHHVLGLVAYGEKSLVRGGPSPARSHRVHTETAQGPCEPRCDPALAGATG